MKKTISLLVAFVLASCTTQRVFDGLNAMRGKPAQTAFDRLGYPDRKENFGSDTAYYWERGNSQYRATLQVVAGPDGIIKDTSAHGNNGGFEFFAGDFSR